MKKLIVFAALSLTVAASAYANNEASCLAMSKFASIAAESREIGMTEKDVIGALTAPISKKVLTRVVEFVYTMQMKPADARKIVYLKCLAGDFPN